MINLQAFAHKLDKIPNKIKYTLMAYGAYQILSSVLPKIRHTFNHLFAKPNFKKIYGECWAVVTGGSDGLGRAFAESLALRGFNIILIARTESKLKVTADWLKTFNVDAKYIAFDFSTTNQQNYVDLCKQISEIGEVGILINNVGAFEMNPFELETKALSLITMNVMACTFITQELVKTMKYRQKKSLIAFIGSETGEVVHKGYCIQAATKAYISHLSKCLAEELKPLIDVRLFTPGPIKTQMLIQNEDYMKSIQGRFASTPIDVANNQLRKVNCDTHIIGTMRHGIMMYIAQNYTGLWNRLN